MSRQDFNETWLSEMPMGIGSFDTFDTITYNIKDLLNNGLKPREVKDNLKSIELSQTQYYWYQNKDEILLGVELEKKPQGLVVRLIGKNPKFKSKPPYASELYRDILNDNKDKSVRLLSDITLSDEGKAIWDKLFDMGLNVSVYDREYPGKSFQTFKNKQEMDQFFANDDTDYKRYQYILSEDGEMLAETRGFFHIRRFRETVPGLS
jgi:hypothetical protein